MMWKTKKRMMMMMMMMMRRKRPSHRHLPLWNLSLNLLPGKAREEARVEVAGAREEGKEEVGQPGPTRLVFPILDPRQMFHELQICLEL